MKGVEGGGGRGQERKEYEHKETCRWEKERGRIEERVEGERE